MKSMILPNAKANFCIEEAPPLPKRQNWRVCRDLTPHEMLGCRVSSEGATLVTSQQPVPRQALAVGRMVRIRGRNGLFVVLSLDLERGFAEIMEQRPTHLIHPAIPVSELRPLDDRLSLCIEHFIADGSGPRKAPPRIQIRLDANCDIVTQPVTGWAVAPSEMTRVVFLVMEYLDIAAQLQTRDRSQLQATLSPEQATEIATALAQATSRVLGSSLSLPLASQ